jgi:hypothetical protein
VRNPAFVGIFAGALSRAGFSPPDFGSSIGGLKSKKKPRAWVADFLVGDIGGVLIRLASQVFAHQSSDLKDSNLVSCLEILTERRNEDGAFGSDMST